MKPARPFLIGGRWRHTDRVAPVVNPFSGETVAEVCQAGKTEADEAIGAAVTAFSAMRRLPAQPARSARSPKPWPRVAKSWRGP